MSKVRVKIKLKAYDSRLIDKTVEDIVKAARRTGANIDGPIPLPTKIQKMTVLRSPHKHSSSREQFELRLHKRMLYLKDVTGDTMEALQKLDVSAGVDIDVKQEI